MSVIVVPNETDSPLIVDANAMLALTIPSKGLKTNTWRNSEIFKLFRSMQI